MVKVVILGLGAAGFGAALAAKKQDRKAEITIIDNKDFDLLHQCGLPFVIEGKIKVSQLLTLKISSRINGDIITNKLSIEPGASFTGNCNMSDGNELTTEQPAPAPAEKKEVGKEE